MFLPWLLSFFFITDVPLCLSESLSSSLSFEKAERIKQEKGGEEEVTAAAPEECESAEVPAVAAVAVSSKSGISHMDDSGEEGEGRGEKRIIIIACPGIWSWSRR